MFQGHMWWHCVFVLLFIGLGPLSSTRVSLSCADVSTLALGCMSGVFTCASCCIWTVALAVWLDSWTACVVTAAFLCVCFTVLLADFERSLSRCLPTLPCPVRLRALASYLKGEVALFVGVLDSEPALLVSFAWLLLLSLSLCVCLLYTSPSPRDS